MSLHHTLNPLSEAHRVAYDAAVEVHENGGTLAEVVDTYRKTWEEELLARANEMEEENTSPSPT